MRRAALLVVLTLVAGAHAPRPGAAHARLRGSAHAPTRSTGGAPIGGLVPTQKRKHRQPRPPSKRDHGRWLSGVTITEYWPAPEAWFIGKLVTTPGLSGKHRIDWLYSAMGVSMQGEGSGSTAACTTSTRSATAAG